MSKSKKTRFYATIDGVERLLFSVQKSSHGGITITSRTTKFFEIFETPGRFGFSDGIKTEFEEQHYSVHESHGGTATTITQKTQLIGQHHSNVAFVPNTKDYLLWPIFWRRYPIFETDSNLLVRKSRDTLIQLAEYSYNNASLIYGVFVARPSFDVSVLMDADVEFKSAVFENHMVIVIPSFINLRSLPTGDVLVASTSSTVVNHTKAPDHFQINAKSLPAEKLIGLNHEFMVKLQNIYLQRLQQDLAEFNFRAIPIPLELLEITQKPLDVLSI